MTAKLSAPTSLEALQRDDEVTDIEVLYGLVSRALMPIVEVKAIITLKKREVGEGGKEGKGLEEKVSDAEDENDLWSSKPSYIDLGQSLMKLGELKVLKMLGYVDNEDLICFASNEIIPEPMILCLSLLMNICTSSMSLFMSSLRRCSLNALVQVHATSCELELKIRVQNSFVIFRHSDKVKRAFRI